MEKVYILFNKSGQILGVYKTSALALASKNQNEGSAYHEFTIKDKEEKTNLKSISEMPERVYDAKHFNDTMPFGKYKGQTIGDIIQNDPSYLQWCIDNISFSVDEDCLDLLDVSLNK